MIRAGKLAGAVNAEGGFERERTERPSNLYIGSGRMYFMWVVPQ